MRRNDVTVHPVCGGVKVGRGFRTLGFIIFLFLFASRTDAQPQATLKPHERTLPLNRELRLTLELVWKGDADLYDIPQPDLSGLDNFEVLSRNISAERRANENRLKHQFVLKPLKEGEYDLGRLRARYYEKGEDAPTAISLPRTPVVVTGPELLSRSAKMALGIGAVVVMTAVTGALVLRSRRVANETRRHADTGEATRADLLAKAEHARVLLLEGDPGGYLEKLSEIASLEPVRAFSDKFDELRELTENVKFGGHTPSPDELMWAEKSVKKAIRNAFPSKDDREKTE
ncbi:MAG: hypothetical protein Kow0099_27320 [Candidatus Abyssubacteria bacterium]